MSEQVTTIIGNQFAEWLRDESRSQGEADSISFPQTIADVQAIVRTMAETGQPITIQGARTGITGGAVPHGGHALNLSKLNRCLGLKYDQATSRFSLTVQSGILLSQVRKALESLNFDLSDWSDESRQALPLLRQLGPQFFPPDPTEASASIGGMISCNASGAKSFFYGPTRNYIAALKVVLADGSVLSLRRGKQLVRDGRFAVTTDEGNALRGCLPDYSMPVGKNASGYYLSPNMDLLDLFVGADGTLGVVVEAELALLPLPSSIFAATALLPDEATAIRLVRAVRGDQLPTKDMEPIRRPVAIEFFNCDTLDLLREQRLNNPGFAQIPDLLPHHHSAVYMEFHDQSEEANLNTMLGLGELINACGGDEQDTWVARNSREMEKLIFFRHSAPESVNMLIDQRRKDFPSLTKLNTDMAVPDQWLEQVMELFNQDLAAAGLQSVLFGHIGDNHVHVNILPRNMDDHRRGKELYLQWARKTVAWGGTVSAEHGIGKIKKAFLIEMYGEAGINKMRAVRRMFDPQGLFGPGNIFDSEEQVTAK